jgi:hypothetical protein
VRDEVVLVHEAQRLRQPRPDKVRKVHVADARLPCSARAACAVSSRAPSDAGAALTWRRPGARAGWRPGGLRPKVISRTSVVLSASDTSTAASTWQGGPRRRRGARQGGGAGGALAARGRSSAAGRGGAAARRRRYHTARAPPRECPVTCTRAAGYAARIPRTAARTCARTLCQSA